MVRLVVHFNAASPTATGNFNSYMVRLVGGEKADP